MKCWINRHKLIIFLILILFPFTQVFALDTQSSIPVLFTKQTAGGVSYNLSIKILIVMTILTVLPALLMTMTAFTRIIIVLAVARQAIGIPNIPSNQIMIGLSLIMTLFVMSPVIEKINNEGIQPYLSGKLNEQQALDASSGTLKAFMMKQTRKADLALFAELAKTKLDKNNSNVNMLVLMPAFITSELKTAFEIGFLILLPFLIIDLVISSILMSMGMMMLSPMVISLPFKILFFVLVDGWTLIVSTLITSFRV